jgi:hypothetical protein
MKVEELRRGIAHLPSDTDIIATWMTRKDVEDYYNNGEPLADTTWYILQDTMTFNGDNIYQELKYIKEYIKVDDENPI